MAKSYTSTHLPKPFRVIILNAGENGGTYEFMVNQTQGSDQRLMYSGMSERFVSSVSGTPAWELVAQGGSFKFNPKEVFANLVSTVQPRVLSDEDDIMNMHRTVRSPQGSSKDLYLQEKHFHYSKDAVQQQIEEYEAMSSRNLMEQTYLDGLKISSRHDGRSEPAYFRMAVLDLKEPRNTRHEGGWHYDWRFFNDGLFYDREGWTKAERSERASIVIERLSRNWNRFAEEKGIVSWIMHGPLLSWYWDGLMFPYDVDIDIQMPISELTRLAREYNQTLVIENPSEGYGRYLIDVGTYIHNRERSYTGNHIDARFIDVDSGIYIDITGLSQSSTNLPKEYDLKPIVSKQDGDSSAEVYNDRRKHFYTLPQISPLRYSMMGGVPLYVPHEIRERLEWEYSRGLTSYEYRGWYFVPKLQLWVMKEKLLWLFNKEDYQNDEQKFDKNKMVELVKALSDDEAMRLLEDDDILTEYYFTCQLTDWHMHEKTFLFTAEGKDNVAGMDDPSTRKSYNNLVGKVKFSKPLRKALFEYENFERMAHHRVGTQGRVRENA
ncbi:hypothetical protein JCM33374_g5590 [Metschnikowia sp. JCM 33374]|nr:hypothetical protein JCM33374_g5590 [Metschnikowia sp. JCM 33374]